MAKDLNNQILDVSSEVLPNETMSEILSYLGKKERLSISMVNQRWFQNINSQIEDIQIRRPTTTTENLEELQKFINRFQRLRSLSLDSRVDNYSELLPLKSLALKGISIEFGVTGDLIKTKNRRNGLGIIKRIKQEDFEDFAHFEYKPSQIICFEVHEDFEMLKEEVMSLNSLRRISIVFLQDVISRQFLESILTRSALKQIDIYSYTNLDFNIEQEFPKNYTVEEVTFKFSGQTILNFKRWKKVFDALPNIKRVRFVEWYNDTENLCVFIKILSVFKNLESLHFAIENFDVQKIQDLLNIVKDFPIKAKVVIALMV